jgi:acetolactate synthase-1/2/3 large subunit
MVKISDVIVDFLLKNNIEVVFGVIGSANSHIFDSINNCGKIKIIANHHEQACVMSMGAYYRTTGKLSAAIVTAGGGSSNAFTVYYQIGRIQFLVTLSRVKNKHTTLMSILI